MSIQLVHPCPTANPTDAFGWRAAIPGVVAAQLHTGQDYAAPRGTPVRAAHSGRVNRLWWDEMASGAPAGGNMLQIGAAAFSTRYAHLDSYAVALGQHVEAGQIIGWVGSTGAATGDHLHFELLLPGGQFVNPVPYLTASPASRKETTLMMIRDSKGKIFVLDEMGADHLGDFGSKDIANEELIYAGTALYGSPVQVNDRQRDLLIAVANRRWERKAAQIAKAR